MDWKIGKSSGQCHKCGRGFAANEGFYSALYDTKDVFERRDFCLACWRPGEPLQAGQAAEAGPFSFWLTAAEEAPKRRGVDLELVKEVFDRLEGDLDETRLKIRYFLSLILMRKHALKYIGTESEGDKEYMVARTPRQQREYRIVNPNLTQGELADVKAELENLLDMDLGAEKNGGGAKGAPETT